MREGRGIRRVFRLGPIRGEADRELDRELAHHFDATIADLEASGFTPAEARAEARRRFGDERAYRRELSRLARSRDRRIRLVDSVATASSAVRDAARGLARSPMFSIVLIAIVALGVGANATMFGVLDRLFLRPPAHVDDPASVRRIFVHLQPSPGHELGTQSTHTYPDYREWASLDVFESAAAYTSPTLTVGHGESAARVPAVLATASLFPTLRVQPALGRFFDESDDQFGAAPVAVLGYSYWQSQYGGRADAIGAVIDVGSLTYTIVGVAPNGFTGVELERVDIWLPLHRAALVEEGGTEWVDSRGYYWIDVIARLADGVAPQAAEAAATAAHRRPRTDQERYDAEADVELASLMLARTGQASREARVVPWLMGVALIILLLAAASMANLLLARGMRHRRDTAVRLALGVSRRRLIGTVIAESTILALLGGATAVAVAAWGGDIIRSMLLPDIGWETRTDVPRIALASAGLALITGLLAGVLPAVRSGRSGGAAVLRGGGRGITRGRSRARSALLVFQIAASVLLLVGTGLFVASLRSARGIDLGFDASRVLLVRLEPEGGYPGGEAMTALYREARSAIDGMPGVDRTTIPTVVPFQNSRGIGDDLRVPGLDSLPRTRAGGAYINAVTGEYFETMAMRIIRGRGLDDSDDAGTAPHVAVVNETMARLFWPNSDALGHCLIIRDAPCAEVVGIVADHHRYELEEDESMHYYVPLARAPYPWPPRGVLVRTSSPESLAPAITQRLRAALPGVRLVSATPYRNVIDPLYRSWQLGTRVFAVFGGLALLVASLGLFSVLAFDVAERRPELGVRAALGATRMRVIAFVLGGGLRLAVIGVTIGIGAALLAAPRAESLLFGVSAREPLVLAGVALLLMVVCAAASGVPAWRAARVGPNEALRGEE